MRYNTVIIGGGLGGLFAGATLTKFGKKVLLLEQHYKPGGCATSFKRGDFVIEVGLHEMNGLDETDGKLRIFKMLGVDKHVEFVQAPELYAMIKGNDQFVFPHGMEKARAMLTKKYPNEKKGIDRFFKLISGIRTEIGKLPKPGWRRKFYMPFMPLLYPNTVEASRHTLGSWMDKHISNEQLKLELCAHAIYFGDDPYALTMYYFGMAMSGFIGGGGHFIKGGSQKLSDYLANYIDKNGGKVLLGKKAEKINTEHGKVTSVTFSDTFNPDLGTTTVECDNAVASCAVPLVPQMLSSPHADRLKKIIAPLKESCSVLSLYLGFNTDLKAFGVNHYSNYIKGDDVKTLKDMGPNYRGDWAKRSIIFVDYGKVDAGLAPAGKSVGAICTADYIEDWEGLSESEYKIKKAEVTGILLQRLENQFPGIRDSIEYHELATSKTVQRYTLNPKGVIYGFAQTPAQAGFKRLRDNFLLPNLYFASAWTFPGGGFAGAIFSGFLAAIKMKDDKIWSECDTEHIDDARMMELAGRKNIDPSTLELSFKKPDRFNNQNGNYALLRLADPIATEFDLPYRWLPVASELDDEYLRFNIPLNGDNFNKSCSLLKTGDKALVLVPTGT